MRGLRSGLLLCFFCCFFFSLLLLKGFNPHARTHGVLIRLRSAPGPLSPPPLPAAVYMGAGAARGDPLRAAGASASLVFCFVFFFFFFLWITTCFPRNRLVGNTAGALIAVQENIFIFWLYVGNKRLFFFSYLIMDEEKSRNEHTIVKKLNSLLLWVM